MGTSKYALGLLALALVGCGSDSDPKPASSTNQKDYNQIGQAKASQMESAARASYNSLRSSSTQSDRFGSTNTRAINQRDAEFKASEKKKSDSNFSVSKLAMPLTIAGVLFAMRGMQKSNDSEPAKKEAPAPRTTVQAVPISLVPNATASAPPPAAGPKESSMGADQALAATLSKLEVQLEKQIGKDLSATGSESLRQALAGSDTTNPATDRKELENLLESIQTYQSRQGRAS